MPSTGTRTPRRSPIAPHDRSSPLIATAPINWHNEANPPGTAVPSYPAILDAMVDAGYGATEWSPSLPGFVPALERDLAARGLRVTGGYFDVDLTREAAHDSEIRRAVDHAAFLARLGAKHLVVADRGDPRRAAVAGRVRPEDGLDDAAFGALARGLNRLGAALRDRGDVRPVFHNHVATYVETPGELARLVEALDPELVDLCLDTGHLVYGGGDPLEALERWWDRIPYLHLKDVDAAVLARARDEGWDFRTALQHVIFCELGRGGAGVRETLDSLVRRRFGGVLVLEQDTARDPHGSAGRNRRFVREVAGW